MWFDIRWVMPEDVSDVRHSNVDHIAQYGLNMEDVEQALVDTYGPERRNKVKDRWEQAGFAVDGTLILVIYEYIDEMTIYPITAYSIED